MEKIHVTKENYDYVLVRTLMANWETLRLFAVRAAQVGIVDQAFVDNMGDAQWEIMFHKLRSANPFIKTEEKLLSEAWCLSRGIYPGGKGDESKEVLK